MTIGERITRILQTGKEENTGCSCSRRLEKPREPDPVNGHVASSVLQPGVTQKFLNQTTVCTPVGKPITATVP